jgi:hypothetical protein
MGGARMPGRRKHPTIGRVLCENGMHARWMRIEGCHRIAGQPTATCLLQLVRAAVRFA